MMSLPIGAHAHITGITPIPGVTGASPDRAWNVSVEIDAKPVRSIDVVVDAKSGETFFVP